MIETSELGTNSVHYKPYRKPLNKFERIPWHSHYPLDVKRGTFIGEMSRLAAISSTIDYYTQALNRLRNIYLDRGYPPKLINCWYAQHVQERWSRRHENETEETDGVLALKSHFNPVWEELDFLSIADYVQFTVETIDRRGKTISCQVS